MALEARPLIVVARIGRAALRLVYSVHVSVSWTVWTMFDKRQLAIYCSAALVM